jgi:hypothetical protein
MKTLLMLLPVVLLCSCATKSGMKVSREGIVAGVNAPQRLQLLGEAYEARYSASEKDKCLVDYYRAGESKKSWKKMLALRLDAAGLDSLQTVENMQSSVEAGGASAVRSFRGKNTNDYGLEFTLMSHGVVELDVFRFVNRSNGSGTISLQYAEKIPFEQLREVGKSKLPEYYAGIRTNVVKAMESIAVPLIEQLPEKKIKK